MITETKGLCKRHTDSYTKWIIRTVAALCASLTIVSSFAGVGSSGSGRFYGEITDFASIFVNGVEYDISTATILINGTPSTQADLRLGMAVRVEGTINVDGVTGTATLVEYLGDIEAALDAAPMITGDTGRFTMAGLVVNTTARTRYEDGVTLASLAAGNIVEVSGYFNAGDGSYTATRIEKKNAFRKTQLRGYISNVTATTFVLGPTLVVNYSAVPNHDIPSGGFTNGMLVEVKNPDFLPSGGTLAADRVSDIALPIATTNISLGQVQGVAANVSASGFAMGNLPVAINASTVFDGVSQASLANNTNVIASGPVVNGVMTAQFVTIPVSITKAWSRKTHGTVGDFDLKIETRAKIDDTKLTVEPRVIGSGHKIVVEFNGPVTSLSNVTVKDASGVNVGSATFTIPVAPGNQVHVTITGIPDNKRINLTLNGVNLVGNNATLPIGFLVGDVNNSRGISAGHLSEIKARSGHAVDAENFKYDLKLSGSIDVVDLLVVKARNGRVLAP